MSNNNNDGILRPRFAKTYHLLKEQVPRFLDEDGSNFEDFMTVYYEWLNTNVDVAITPDFMDIDFVDERYVECFVEEYASFAKDFEHADIKDTRRLVKYAKQMYSRKGTAGSFKLFFKLMFGIDPEVYYTKDDVLYLSSIDGTSVNRINFDITNTIYQRVAVNEQLENIRIGDTFLDIISANRFEDRVEVVFNNRLLIDPEEGDLAIFGFEKTQIKVPVITTVVEYTPENIDTYGFRNRDAIRVTPMVHDSVNSPAVFNVNNVSRGAIEKVIVFDTGSGYSVGEYITFVQDLSEFRVYITEVDAEGAVAQVSLANGQSFYVTGAVESDPIVFTVDSAPTTFSDTPSVVTERVNSLGVTVQTAKGTGFLINCVIPQAGRITDLTAIDNGSALKLGTARVRGLCSFLVADPSKIVGNPIVEIQRFATNTGQWIATGYGGKITSVSEGGTRVTLSEFAGTSESGARLKFPNSTFLNPKGGQATSVFRIVVPQINTGVVISTLTACYDFQLLQVEASSFSYGTVSTKRTIEANERQVLSSSGARLRDKDFYHEFAYFIKSPLSAVDWMNPFKESVHPVGFRVVSELSTFEDDVLEGRTTISESFRYEQDGLYSDGLVSYSFPNRVLSGVEDLNVVPIYSRGREYPAGYQISEEFNVQFSPAFMTEINDEINAQRFEYEVDLFDYWNKIFIDGEDHYNRYQKPRKVTRVLVPERASAPVNQVYLGDDQNGNPTFEDGYVSSTTSADENYYYSGWVKHSKDLYDKRHNYDIDGEITIEPNPARTVYGSFTDYDGVWLRREKLEFPAGNTPIRYLDIKKIGQGEYTQSDTFINAAFPADDRRVNELKKSSVEVNINPDRDAYIEINDVPQEDDTLATLHPSTHMMLKQGTMDFSIDESVNVVIDDDGFEIGGISDDIKDALGGELYISEGYRSDSWWSYEPMGMDYDESIPPSSDNIMTTQRLEEGGGTRVRHYYVRYVGERRKHFETEEGSDIWVQEETQFKHKDDSWYSAVDWGTGIAGIPVDEPVFADSYTINFSLVNANPDREIPYNPAVFPNEPAEPALVLEPTVVPQPDPITISEPFVLGQPNYVNFDNTQPAEGELPDSINPNASALVVPESDPPENLHIPIEVTDALLAEELHPNVTFLNGSAQEPRLVVVLEEPVAPVGGEPVEPIAPNEDDIDNVTYFRTDYNADLAQYQVDYVIYTQLQEEWDQYLADFAAYEQSIIDREAYEIELYYYSLYAAELLKFNVYRSVNLPIYEQYRDYVIQYDLDIVEYNNQIDTYNAQNTAFLAYISDLEEYEQYLVDLEAYQKALALYEDDARRYAIAVLNQAGVVYDAAVHTAPFVASNFAAFINPAIAVYPDIIEAYEQDMEAYHSESFDYNNYIYATNTDGGLSGDEAAIEFAHRGSSIRKVVLEDTDIDNNLQNYEQLIGEDRERFPYIKFDDERKTKYSGIEYPEDRIAFDDPFTTQRIRPRHNEIFLIKEIDLANALAGTLEFTTTVPNRIGLYTFVGDEAFSQKWQSEPDEE